MPGLTVLGPVLERSQKELKPRFVHREHVGNAVASLLLVPEGEGEQLSRPHENNVRDQWPRESARGRPERPRLRKLQPGRSKCEEGALADRCLVHLCGGTDEKSCESSGDRVSSFAQTIPEVIYALDMSEGARKHNRETTCFSRPTQTTSKETRPVTVETTRT